MFFVKLIDLLLQFIELNFFIRVISESCIDVRVEFLDDKGALRKFLCGLFYAID